MWIVYTMIFALFFSTKFQRNEQGWSVAHLHAPLGKRGWDFNPTDSLKEKWKITVSSTDRCQNLKDNRGNDPTLQRLLTLVTHGVKH
jgi:hypothetical protein